MKCKSVRCKREIPDNSIFCPWCGFRQIAEANEIKVAPPKHNSKAWYNRIMVGDERVYISAKTEDEYYAKARAAKANLIEIEKSRPKLSLGTAIDNYIKDNSVLSPSTIKAYKSYRKSRFKNYMERDVTEINYQRMISDECKTKVKPKTIINAWRLVTGALAHANVEFAPVNLPQNPKSERPWLDYEQVKTFCKAVQGKDCELAALLALNGLRRSEILHLSADDVDLKSGIIHVRGATVFSPSGAMVDKATNKNRSSTRDVFIIIPRLNELIRGKKGRLITTHPNTLHSQINSVCRKNKLPEVGFHGLRHSYISLGFHLGVQDLTIASEVGHSTVQTTQNVYRHLAEQDRKAEIERMKQFFM
jgi:integrase